MEKLPDNVPKPVKSNVFQFPVHQRVADGVIIPPDFKLRQTKDYLNVITEDIAAATLSALQFNGIDTGSQEFQDSMTMITLMLECALYRTEGIQHDFDELMDTMIDILNPENDAPENEQDDT